METLFEIFVLFPLCIFIFWELFVARVLGISVYTALGLRIGSRWAIKNFTPKLSDNPKTVRQKVRSTKNRNNDLFYEDA